LILLCEQASATKRGGQELIGGLDVKVHRNHFGRQLQSFVQDVDLPFLNSKDNKETDVEKETEKQALFPAVFIRAPVVDQVLHETDPSGRPIEILARFPSQGGDGDNIVAIRQGNVFGTSFHPELTDDVRIHVWWLRQVLSALGAN
jgi:5'-phosphate synthase pdxT subunit